MSAKTSKRSLQARGPLDTSTPKHEQYSVEKKQDENFENISYESDHTEPRLSPVCSPNSAAQKSEMTQSAVKKGAVAQAAPSVKKNGSRRRSRSRSRSRNIRRSTPTRTIRSTPDTKVAQIISKSEETDKPPQVIARRSVRNIAAKGEPVSSETVIAPKLEKPFIMARPKKPEQRLLPDFHLLSGHPHILSLLYFLMALLYGFILYKAFTYFELGRYFTGYRRIFRSNASP